MFLFLLVAVEVHDTRTLASAGSVFAVAQEVFEMPNFSPGAIELIVELLRIVTSFPRHCVNESVAPVDFTRALGDEITQNVVAGVKEVVLPLQLSDTLTKGCNGCSGVDREGTHD